MRRGAAIATIVVGTGISVYPVLLGHEDRGVLGLAAATLATLGIAVVFPRLPAVLSAFCCLWCLLYAVGLLAGHPDLDPLAPAMAAGLYIVIELGEMTSLAATGVTLDPEVTAKRLGTIALLGASGAVLAAACLAVSGLARAGGLGAVVLAAIGAAFVLAIPTMAGRRGQRRR